MPARIWALGEVSDGQPTRLSLEVATLARGLAEAGGGEAAALLIGPGVAPAAEELARYVPRVLVAEGGDPEASWAPSVAPLAAALLGREAPDFLLVGASIDGRDLAGLLAALLGWGVLANAFEVEWQEGVPVVGMSVFGGRLVTRSTFSGQRGIVIVRTGSATAEPAGAAGQVENVVLDAESTLPAPRIVERVDEAGATGPIEEARVIVAGGRGVGGPEGFELLGELAKVLDGVIGGTRAVVDAGWLPYSQQIGQTGKIVKPALYVAAGISGAIQHKVGVQTAGTIVAINKDPDAPIAEFADLVVVGDLFQLLPPLTTALRARRG